MNRFKFLLLFLRFSLIIYFVRANTYTVNVGTEHHVNVVDEKFLSFTVDPKYLFSSSEKYNSQESTCMASSLSPALLRIAGPSTQHMTFHNATITITQLSRHREEVEETHLKVTNWQWRRFVQWAKSNGFDLVFAINNEDKMESGLWDPNTALNILTVAEKAGVEKIFWQLGYECDNQTIEEYLNDLETLRVIFETFPPRGWGVVGGDVTKCLQRRSHADFKDYVTLSDQMLDAVFLQGNSSAQELERMSDADRLKLLKRLSQSSTPLWLTESAHFTEVLDDPATALNRAADWLSSLGYSARNGFAVHFRELAEEELFKPTLSFYMALLYKNLVGERVLHVDMEASEAVLFAHCASLRHKPVPGAVTFYGANMADEPARFAVKMTRREEGGDVMQFVLGVDNQGHIVVNGHPMLHEGDVRPVVKRLRPYRTLLINLPPKSIGFWVLANTNIEACHMVEESAELVEDISAADVKNEAENEMEELIESGKPVQNNVDENDVTEDKMTENNIVDITASQEEKINEINVANSEENISTDEDDNQVRDSDSTKEQATNNEQSILTGNENATLLVNGNDLEPEVSLETKKSEETLKEDKSETPKMDKERKAVKKVVVNKIDESIEDNDDLSKSRNLKKRIDNLNDNLKHVHKLLETKSKKISEKKLIRMKRDIEGENLGNNKFKKQMWRSRYSTKNDDESKPKFQIIKRISSWNPKNFTKQLRFEKSRRLLNSNRKKLSKRHLIAPKEETIDKLNEIVANRKILSRKPRSTHEHKYSIKNLNLKDDLKNSLENEIEEFEKADEVKLLKILRKIHEELKELPDTDDVEYTDNGNASKDEDQIVVKTKLSDDGATLKRKEKSKKGLLKTTIGNIVGVLSDLNRNLKNFWSALNILE